MNHLTSAYDQRALLKFNVESFQPVLGYFPQVGVSGLNPAFWPIADASIMFLWSAMDVVGSVILPDEWASTDLQARSVAQNDLPIRPHTNTIPPQKLPPSVLQSGNFHRPESPRPRDDDHVTLFRNMEVYNEKSSTVASQCAAAARLRKVYSWLVNELVNGKIRSVGILAKGGKPSPIQPHEWSGSNGRLGVMFTGGFDKVEDPLTAPGFRYVFVIANELKARLAGVATTETKMDGVDILRLPPYLRFAVQLAVSENWLTGGAEDTSTVRENLVEARWGEALPDIMMSNKAKHAIVHLTGIPNVAAVNRAVRQAAAKAPRKNGVTGKNR